MFNLKQNSSVENNLKVSGVVKPLILCSAPILFVFLWHTIAFVFGGLSFDTDTSFIIATGRYIIQNHEVPTVNPFVIHEGFSIIVQQWLYDVFIAALVDSFGLASLVVLSYLSLALKAILLFAYAKLYTENIFTQTLVVSLCLEITVYYNTARPASISFPICIGVVLAMEYYKRTRAIKYLVIIPFLSVLLINIQAAMWPMLFVLLLPYFFFDSIPQKGAVKEYFKSWFIKNRFILLTFVVSFLMGFINPNGLRGMGYLFLSYTNANSIQISELQTPTLLSTSGLLVIVGICLVVFYIKNHYKAGLDIPFLYLTCGTLLLASLHYRHLWFLSFCLIPLICVSAKPNCSLLKRWANDNIMVSLFAGLTILLLCFSVYLVINRGEMIEDDADRTVAAADFLDETIQDKEDIVLYTGFNNGAYMEFRGYKVYFDARPELFAKQINGKEDILEEYIELCAGAIDYTYFNEKYGFTHWIVLDDEPLCAYLTADSNCEMVVDGNGYKLFAKSVKTVDEKH